MENKVIENTMALKVAVKSAEPRGKGSRECRACKNHRGFIRKYELMMCRRCFREYAEHIGFVKDN